MTKQHLLSCTLVVTAGALGVLASTGLSRSSTSKGDKAFGEYLSAECVTCHQKSGKVVGGIPAIVGWPEDQFVAVMLSYREGARENQVMRSIVGKFNHDEIEALAAYFGSLKPQK